MASAAPARPLRSFTIVGDIAQASSMSAASNWADAVKPLTSDFRLEELTVNYRTPTQIALLAEAEARRHGLEVTPSRSVRDSEWEPRQLSVPAAEIVAAVVDAVAHDRGIDSAGTLAVIAPDVAIGQLHAALTAAFGDQVVGRGLDTLSRQITVLGPRTAKGLEFDAVVVADPEGIVRNEPRGAGSLYVALTRATQRLTVVTPE
ncbi:hypothetical protein GCM10025866_35490 [Naasia aerilata]|uniref:UvrD-like helicase C-terminal domain-containing protein n=1 Tax=Naasia aerilata TaxID=1162966 RepID=A0ABN6XVF6_9MICO|nr:hypothetical protein GCM10025866_35490 [Naasia aerilata]